LVEQVLELLACKFIDASRICGALHNIFTIAPSILYAALQAYFGAR